MRTLPILFNAEMVRAILDGRKTCTRRVVKPQWHACEKCMHIHNEFLYDSKSNAVYCARCGEPLKPVKKPPYQPGDILYVRETFVTRDLVTPDRLIFHYRYRATDPNGNRVPTSPEHDEWEERPWTPSIHMPKAAARIWLRVTDVRVERLQDITEAGALREGAIDNRGLIHSPDNEYDCIHTAREHFKEIWDSTIKKADIDCYGWDVNPWIWAIEFERCEKPAGPWD